MPPSGQLLLKTTSTLQYIHPCGVLYTALLSKIIHHVIQSHKPIHKLIMRGQHIIRCIILSHTSTKLMRLIMIFPRQLSSYRTTTGMLATPLKKPPLTPITSTELHWILKALPSAGKSDRLQKITTKLYDDSLSSFVNFCTILHAVLQSCSYHPHFLPLLYPICPDTDLTISMPYESSWSPTLEYWQCQHDNVGMTLYALLLETVPATAPQAKQIVKQALGAPNGFTVFL
jgi:hypothetical protein